MPLFYDLDVFNDDTPRVAGRLKAIREMLQNFSGRPEGGIPPKNASASLLLATWNLQAFDGGESNNRTDESFWYIAEIISHFDLIAIQEVGAHLGALNKLKKLLGDTWRYVVSDVSEGKKGNDERLAFLYDRRKIRFSGVAGEIVIPPVEDSRGRLIRPASQLVRTPSIIGFESGWFRFMVSTVHIIWGEGVAESPARVAEIRALAEFLKDRSEDQHAWSQNQVLLGDFNIFNANPDNAAYAAITRNGFVIPEALQGVPATNVGADPRFYDQIALKFRENNLAPTGRGGVIDYFDVVYRNQDYEDYVVAMMDRKTENDPDNRLVFKRNGNRRTASERQAYYRTHWRRRQMSDHLPMWLELKIDYGENYLRKRSAP